MFRDLGIANIVPPNVSVSRANRGPDAATRVTKTATHATVINNARFITMLSFPSGHLAGFGTRLADAAGPAVLLPYPETNAVRARSPATRQVYTEKSPYATAFWGNQRVATWAIFSLAMEVVPLSYVAQTVDRLTAPCCTGGWKYSRGPHSPR